MPSENLPADLLSLLLYHFSQLGTFDTRTKIPLIIAYPGYSAICNVDALSNLWPKTLTERIGNTGVEAIHIAFKKEPIFDAISRFYVNGEHLPSGKNYYNRQSYVDWGLIE